MTRFPLVAGAALLLAAPAFAESAMTMSGMDHSAHGHEGSGAAMQGYMDAMDDMMGAMAEMPSTGNADADFLVMMIPHHQSALDMAKVELAHGTDPETRALAERIIAAQEQEISEMTEMLARLAAD
ncbi:DUF305 domain-containing protein [Mangrovicoccus sp. HB161399]|uniref:CopM family metallochaperone n=1 Tax=Mangrovicoccus sp. HB161399 TaxID=2720392 RepID=UPI001556C0CF|nr:DUF305 domain-containing protein [Mangrovicoccus sp. HB161399]